mmetsp:Transcript_46284/g.83429  ORF Transcript_46284/g.83429 Transcript_46284/m.83429 type:complete len:577 (+) Transcript_46284:58-1788(+)
MAEETVGDNPWTENSNLIVRRRSDSVAKEDEDTLELDDVAPASFQLSSGKDRGSGEHEEGKHGRKSMVVFGDSREGGGRKSMQHRKSMFQFAPDEEVEEHRKELSQHGIMDRRKSTVAPADGQPLSADRTDSRGRKSMAAPDGFDKRKSMAMDGRKSIVGDAIEVKESRKTKILDSDAITRKSLMQGVRKSFASGLDPNKRKSMMALLDGGKRMSLTAKEAARRKSAARQSMSGAPGQLFGQEVMKILRPKVNALLTECMQIASYRLLQTASRADAILELGSTATSAGHVAAWPFEILAPLLWLPAVMPPPPSALTASSSRDARHIPKKTGGLQIYGRVEIPLHSLHPTKAEDEAADGANGTQNAIEQDDPEVVQEAFYHTFSDAKLAQGQALAARHEVQRLEAALKSLQDRAREKQAKKPSWGAPPPRPGSEQNETHVAHEVTELEQKKQELKKKEAQLDLQCRELSDQLYGLQMEVVRREQRATIHWKKLRQALPELISSLSKSSIMKQLEMQLTLPDVAGARKATGDEEVVPQRTARGSVLPGSAMKTKRGTTMPTHTFLPNITNDAEKEEES